MKDVTILMKDVTIVITVVLLTILAITSAIVKKDCVPFRNLGWWLARAHKILVFHWVKGKAE